MIKFSIIIPTFNCEKYIVEAVESCLKQTYTNFEVLIVDDGSTDNTEQVVAPLLSDKVKYYKKNNTERGAARNFGVEKASGDYVYFLDSDDWLLPNHLEVGFNKINEHNKPEVVHNRFKIYHEDTKKLVNSELIKKDLKKILIKGNILGCMIFVRKDIMKLYPYSPNRNLSGTEDKLHNLILASQFDIKICNQRTIVMREHEERSMAADSLDSWLIQMDAFYEEISSEKRIIKYFGNNGVKKIKAYYIQMIAIKYMISGYKSESMKFYIQSIKLYFGALFNKNFLRLIYFGIK